jgi:hypothetical protein
MHRTGETGPHQALSRELAAVVMQWTHQPIRKRNMCAHFVDTVLLLDYAPQHRRLGPAPLSTQRSVHHRQ